CNSCLQLGIGTRAPLIGLQLGFATHVNSHHRHLCRPFRDLKDGSATPFFPASRSLPLEMLNSILIDMSLLNPGATISRVKGVLPSEIFWIRSIIIGKLLPRQVLEKFSKATLLSGWEGLD
ncbi:hypothetical protein L2E82_42587, partial [Cichorium intybus]